MIRPRKDMARKARLTLGAALCASVILCVPASAPARAESALDNLQQLVDTLQAFIVAHPGTRAADKIEDAHNEAHTAMTKLIQGDVAGAAGYVEAAIGTIDAAVSAGLLNPALGHQWMLQATDINRQLALDAHHHAASLGGTAQEVGEGIKLLAEGDASYASGAFKQAAAKYKDAYAKFRSALP